MDSGIIVNEFAQHFSNSLPREAMLSAVYAVVVCLCVCVSVCLSVGLSVCLSHSSIVSKRLNVGSRKQRRMIAP